MGTRKIVLTGYGYWAKVFEENRDERGFEDALVDIGGQCTIDVDLDAAEVERLQKTRSMLRGKPSPDNPGHTRIRFKRKWTEQFGGGEPVVQKEDGSKWSYFEDGTIGNGSTVKVVLSVYDTSRKTIVGTRLDGVKVVKHLEYIPDDGFEEDTPEVAAPEPKAAPAKVAAKKAVLEDEIPF